MTNVKEEEDEVKDCTDSLTQFLAKLIKFWSEPVRESSF